MIAIINDGKNKRTRGVHGYRVQINDKVICTFEHLREDGLAECLRKAAAAVGDAEAAKSRYLMSLCDGVVEKG